MVTKEMKEFALDHALRIAEEYAKGGGCASSPSVVLGGVYHKLIELYEDIEKTEDE